MVMDKYNAPFATVMTILLIGLFVFVPYWAGDLGGQWFDLWPTTNTHLATWAIGWFYLLLGAVALFAICIAIFLVVGIWMSFYDG